LCSDLNDILGFTIEGVGCSVRTFTMAAAVHGVGVELRLE
jgi:hypothetical protein